MLAAVPRLRTAAAGIETADESLWMDRSVQFSDSITSADLAHASAASYEVAIGDGTGTMPGITTMWIGTLARGVWGLGRAVGWWANRDGADFAVTDSGWFTVQASMAVVTSVLVGVLVFLLVRWVGWRAAAVAGVLVATEPFLVAHGAVLHTDELLALFGATALVATALALGLPEPTPWAFQRRAALVAGGLWGAALLTKMSALMFLPGIGLLGLWALWVAAKRTDGSVGLRQAIPPVLRVAAWWLVAAVGVVAVFYPALWFDPGGELQAARDSLGLATQEQWQFFLGEATGTPGPAFYFVALPLRVTPWFLAAGVAGSAALCWHRPWRRLAVAIGCMAGPPLVVQSVASKQFARYGLVLLVMVAIVVGVALGPLLDAIRQRLPTGRGRAMAAAAVSMGVFVHAVAVAPWGLGYFNPVLGGPAVAKNAIVIGWGEGTQGTGEVIEQDRAGDCHAVTVFAFIALREVTCGERAVGNQVPTYVVIYVAEMQRMTDAARSTATAGRELVGVVEQRGIIYVEVFGPPASAAGEDSPTARELLHLFGYS